jgi:hypothetical protein
LIPPTREIRLRSIRRWLQDLQPDQWRQLTRSRGLESTAEHMDEAMIQQFEGQEDALMASLIRSQTWGTQAGMQQFQMQRLMVWSAIREQFLPVISETTWQAQLMRYVGFGAVTVSQERPSLPAAEPDGHRP